MAALAALAAMAATRVYHNNRVRPLAALAPLEALAEWQ